MLGCWVKNMVVVTPHAILDWKPESESAWEHYLSVPRCAQIITNPRVKPYRSDYPPRLSPSAPDPFIHGILSREGGLSQYLSCMAEAGVFPALDSNPDLDLAARDGEVATATVDKTSTKALLPLPGRPILSASPTPDLAAPSSALPENPYPIHLDFYTIGPAVQGVPNTVHGGATTALFDAMCGKAAFLHRDPTGQLYTAYTNTRFRKPIVMHGTTSVIVLLKSQISHRLSKGKKIVVLGTIESPEGKVYATCESMCIETHWKNNL